MKCSINDKKILCSEWIHFPFNDNQKYFLLSYQTETENHVFWMTASLPIISATSSSVWVFVNLLVDLAFEGLQEAVGVCIIVNGALLYSREAWGCNGHYLCPVVFSCTLVKFYNTTILLRSFYLTKTKVL